jgi:hypothetical protein
MTEETETAKALREMREEMRRRAETVMDRMGETNVEPRHAIRSVYPRDRALDQIAEDCVSIKTPALTTS